MDGQEKRGTAVPAVGRLPGHGQDARATRAFTLIEMLVVIFIMAFLITFVVAAALRYQREVRVKTTRMLVQKIGIGLANYYGDFRSYPPLYDVPRTENLYHFLGDDLSGLSPQAKLVPYQEFDAADVVRLNPATLKTDSGGQLYFRDSFYRPDDSPVWKHLIIYWAQSLQQAQRGNYRLYSTGYDGIAWPPPYDADNIDAIKVE